MNAYNELIPNAPAPNRTIVAPDAESKKKLVYIPRKAVPIPITDERTIILRKLFVSILAEIAGATIAAASKVTPILFIEAITTRASTSAKAISRISVLIPYTVAVSLSNETNNNLFWKKKIKMTVSIDTRIIIIRS